MHTTTQSPRKTGTRKKRAMHTGEERYERMQQAAYLLAEKDGFHKDPVEYWLAAESAADA